MGLVRRQSAPLDQRLLHERVRRREVGNDEGCVEPQHAAPERALAALVSSEPVGVRGAVGLNDEPRRPLRWAWAGCGCRLDSGLQFRSALPIHE
jgi:hypothetical protein